MSTTSTFITAIAEGDHIKANEVFTKAMKEKVNNVLDIKRVAITSDVFNETAIMSEAKSTTMTFGQSIAYDKQLVNPERFLKKSTGNGVTYFEYKDKESAYSAYLKNGQKNGSLRLVRDKQFT